MHKSSMLRMKFFADHYVTGGKGKKILDVGSYDVNGCYKEIFSDIDIEYVGLDIEPGNNVDIVVEKLYCWDSLKDESFDYIISGQAFEHIEYPWLTMQEIYKKLKPEGIICIIAPNGLGEHRFPKDCYRYYADGMNAMASWAGFEMIEVSVAGIPKEEVFSDWDDKWNDVCLVACKSKAIRDRFADNIMFSIERRYDLIQDLKLEYDFMTKWKNNQKKIDKIILDYIEKRNYKKIYIIGNKNIGITVANLFQDKGCDYTIVEPEELEPSENIADTKQNEIYILTLLDSNRTLIREYRKKYCLSTIFYVDELVRNEEILKIINEMKSYFSLCKRVYIYGAGVNGKVIWSILNKFSFEISGFVVSDEKYTENKNTKNLFKISEISPDEGIIISPNDDGLIKEILKSLGFKYCLDGKVFLM